MKQIHRYIFLSFLNVLFFAVLFSILLFFLSDFFGHLASFLKNSVGFYSIVKYYFYYTPFALYYSAPLIFALANLITLGFMSMRNEIIVMRSSGINIIKICAPILILSLVFGIFMFIADDVLVGKSLDRAYYIERVDFEGGNLKDLWNKSGNFFINVGRLNIKNGVGEDVKIYNIKDSLGYVIYAKKMLMEKKDVVLKDLEIIYTKSPDVKKSFKEKKLGIALNARDFLQSPQKNGYDLKELIEYIGSSKDKSYYMSILLFKIFYPLSPFLLTLLSLVFVLQITPRKSDFIKNVFLGGITFIVFVGSFAFITSMGKLSIVNPVMSFVIFILFWIGVSVYNLLKLGI
jgi:lipopolysaccharide export system permease protein